MIRKEGKGWAVYNGTNLINRFQTKREAKEADMGVKARQLEKKLKMMGKQT